MHFSYTGGYISYLTLCELPRSLLEEDVMRLSPLVFLTMLFVFMTVSVHADIPKIISYQGKVTDSGGTPIPDGSYQMSFRIMDAATGGTEVWSSGVHPVVISGGIFDILLGETPHPPIELPFDVDYWLSVTIESEEQSPRQRLASSGYAYMAGGLVAGTEVIGSVNSGTLSAIKVVNTASAGINYGIHSISYSTDGRGIAGVAIATTGENYGIIGRSYSINGTGVYGWADATTGINYGVFGRSYSTNGRGIAGVANATTGENYGIIGRSYSINGTGVYGWADATTGINYGVFGRSYSSNGRGVTGVAVATTGDNFGVYGRSYSTDGSGVSGLAEAATGITFGVLGRSYSTDGRGVYGAAFATTGITYGVLGRSYSTDGYGVYSVGNFAASGSKSCVVKTSRGPKLMYCQESPENWFEDFGEGRLIEGRAHIELDPLFLETVIIDDQYPMKVFVTPRDMECKGLAVIPGQTGFDVGELLYGTSNAPFSYRVAAKRRGFEEKRLDHCKAAETDSYLFPELVDKGVREHEEE